MTLKRPARHKTGSIRTTVQSKIKGRYLLYLPPEYRGSRRRWPLVLFLHGAGERGSNLEKIKAHGPPHLVEQGESFPFILLSPQCPDDRWWSIPFLDALLKEIAGQYRVDVSRIYVTGLSMGGFAAWELAITYPKRFAAIAPICGGGQPFLVHKIKHLPVWAFHGGRDPIVPVRKSREMVAHLQAAGGNVRFTVYPDAEHDVWTETYRNPEFWEWLLAQKKQGRRIHAK